MSTHDLSKTPIVRRFGVRGARWFAWIWFPALYLLLIDFTAKLWMLSFVFTAADSWQGTLFAWFVATLVVVAASLITRMRLEYLAGLEQLQAKGESQ